MNEVKIIECPRDAWQGLPKTIPAEEKVGYLTELLHVGFRHIDAVSFVSPKYVPQMADSEEVMRTLDAREAALLNKTEIIGIVVNEKGLQRALATPGVTTIGYPYSISERFTRQNANASQQESRQIVENIQSELNAPTMDPAGFDWGFVVYISMAFGNPYRDPWSLKMVVETLDWLKGIGIREVSLADTVGKASAEDVSEVFRVAKSSAAGIELGLHLHSRPDGASEKVLAAYEAGCRRFDSALTGLGGCPFAGDTLVGNISTEVVVNTLADRGISTGIESTNLARVMNLTKEIRSKYGS